MLDDLKPGASMDRRTCLGLLAAAPLAMAASPRGRGYSDADFRRAIVIDGLGSPSDPDGKDGVFRASPRGAAELRQSGTTAIQVTVGEVGNAPDVFNRTIDNIAFMGNLIDANPELFVLARSAADIRAAKTAGKTALVYGTQDTSMIGTELDRLKQLAGLGVRVVQLTYNLRNLSGDGSLEPANGGLSKLGRATIERIEAEKLLLDLSHGGRRTIAEAIAAAKRPPTISHTGCRALNDNPRNVDDESLKALADKGGVVGIYWMPFLVPNSKPSGGDLVRHMAHAVNTCGEDHVAIGTDGILSAIVIDDAARAAQKKFYEDRAAKGIAAPGEGADIFNYVADFNSHMRFRMLADALSSAGWPATRIDKVLGANLLRLYGEVWGG
jgi:membrane dipeptidase